jgi:4-amino-4-deoxy-L-arabinose transferase-like glycosyltransferase
VAAAAPIRTTLAAAAGAVAVKVAMAAPFLGRYGWDRDELYFLQASRHLSLGYVDFPVATALVARLVTTIAGPSLIALRIAALVAVSIAIVLVVFCARELGGGGGAQFIAGVAMALSPFGLGGGVIYHPTMLDLPVWVAISYLALRILGRPEPRLWPVLGLVAAIGFETKPTVVALLAVLVVAIAIVGPRRALLDRGVLWAVLILAAGTVPYLIWEATHDWASFTFFPTQAQKTADDTGHAAYIAQQLAFLGGGLPLVVIGIVHLWRQPRLRALALLFPLSSLGFFVEQGRSYYALPAAALPLAAGVVVLAGWRPAGRGRRIAGIGSIVALYAVVGAVAAPIVWPVLPRDTMIARGIWKQSFFKDEIGWPELTAQTAAAWRAIPPAERPATALIARNYGEAGALDHFGPAAGLPTALSGHLSFQYWHPARMPQTSAILVGFPPEQVARLCGTATVVAHIDNAEHLANEELGRTIVHCRLRAPLQELWASEIATDRL